MKTLIITAALSVLSLGNIAEAQDSKMLAAKAKIATNMIASLPNQDIEVTDIPQVQLTTRDLRMLSLLPTQDLNVEIPTAVEETTIHTLVSDKKEQTVKPSVEVRKETRRAEM